MTNLFIWLQPILDALHKDANEAFNSSRQIDFVITKIVELRESGNPDGPLPVTLTLMSPIQPMLAQACKVGRIIIIFIVFQTRHK